jgi:hypothetical protein
VLTLAQTTVKKTFAEFFRTHSDSWHILKGRFTEQELSIINQLLVSPNYYA